MSGKRRPSMLALSVIGVLVGILSGLFGIGGGVILVPLLVFVLGFSQRLAAGTSVAAILPAAAAGGMSYALQGHVDWIAAASLALGMVLGAQLGSYLLAKLPSRLLGWSFLIFMVSATVSLWLSVPQREDRISVSIITFFVLVLVGFATGALSGAVGVGGGIVLVPVLMFFFGSSDLIAKGTSLLTLIPGSISGTISNVLRRNIDLRVAILIGLVSAIIAPVGTLLSAAITPLWSNITFSVLIFVVVMQMLFRMIRGR